MGSFDYTTALSRLKLQFQSQDTKKFRVTILTLFTILTIPALVLITILILIFRFFNQLWVHYFHKDRKNILKMLEPIGQVFANDYFKPNPRLNIVVCWTGEGKITIEALRQKVTTGILDKTTQDTREGKDSIKLDCREPIFPELKCEIVSLGGYQYFKKIENFDVKDYVRMLDPREYENTIGTKNKNVIREKDLKKIVAQMTSKGWGEGRSAWEFVLIDNYVDDEQQKSQTPKMKSVILIRIHHTIADGYSIINLTEGLADTNLKKMSAIPSANFKRKINLGFKNNRTLLGMLLALLLLPYHVALTIDQLLQKDANAWRIPQEKSAKAGQKYFHSWSRNIPVSDIKEIKNKFGVSFQAVLNSLVACAIREVMAGMRQKVPENVSAFLPVPLPGHPEGLSNYFGYMMCRLPVGETSSNLRLKLAEEEVQNLLQSATPFVIFFTYTLAGLYPSIFPRTLLFTDVGSTLLLSSFPANDNLNSVVNCKCADVTFTLGNVAGSTGATVTTTTVYGNIKMAITVDEQICHAEHEIEKFDQSIRSEIKALLGTAVNSISKRSY